MTATTGLDVVEVLRGASAGPWLVAAGAVGGVAAVATVVATVVWWSGPRRRAHGGGARTAWPEAAPVLVTVALGASLLEAGFLLADGADPAGRWGLAVVARVLLLVAVLVLRGGGAAPRLPGADPNPQAAVPGGAAAGGPGGVPGVAPGGLPGDGPRGVLKGGPRGVLHSLLAVLLLLTAGLGAPTTAAAGQLAWPAAVVVVTAALTRVGLALVRARPVTAAPLLLVLLTTALAVPTALWTTPDRVPPHHQERVVVDGLTLDLTVAPVRPGTNEAHLYALDREGRPAPVSDVHLAVLGVAGSRHEMFEVSPDHHLSYILELPPTPPWTVAFTLRGDDGQRREATLHLTGN